MVVGSEKPPADGVEKYESPRIFGQAEKKQQEEEQQLKEKPQEEKQQLATPINPQEAEREERRRKRRRLRRLLRKQSAHGNNNKHYPSFVHLLTADYDAIEIEDDDDDNKKEEHPDSTRDLKRIRIDVDAELGLAPEKEESDPTKTYSSVTVTPSSAYSSFNTAAVAPRIAQQVSVSPADEGWYEGVVSPMSRDDEDSQYLTELQQLIRNNLELFSATDFDCSITQSGRRTTIVRGRVGVRCLHCGKRALEYLANKKQSEKLSSAGDPYPDRADSSTAADSRVYPAGSISYPVNIAGLYSVCTQKPQLHFEHCPNMPNSVRAQLFRLMHDTAAPNSQKTCRSKGGITASLYYNISARRRGLVNSGDGIRFGRDLGLDPLPFETIRMKIEAENFHNSKRSSAAQPAVAGGTVRPTADPVSEQVLAEAVTEKDNPTKLLGRSEDKSMVSDYVFLALRQMAICHAVPSDFTTRGKKTKLMRVGFAGFCCRHCMEPDGAPPYIMDYSCRSFSSAADNLSSAMTNSFMTHLQKCHAVPTRIKKALVAYKRLHQRQMATLPYGSQRRLIHELWLRLRASDVSEEEMQERIKKFPVPVPSNPHLDNTPRKNSTVQETKPVDTTVVSASSERVEDSSFRGSNFPASSDLETLAVLKQAEDSWDPTENNNLILPADRHLVSDYVFLTMRQLKAAFPDAGDSLRRHNTGLPGICCIHCFGKPQVASPSGRSFPTAPDNFASALNSSLYNHMQACYYVSDNLKRVLADVRKVHSAQCSAIKFGSQRRYFNLLFQRLCDMRKEHIAEVPGQSQLVGVATRKSSVALTVSKADLSELGFFQLSSKQNIYMCRHCRMVPVQFRAQGSIVFEKNYTEARSHSKNCKKESFDLSICAETLGEVLSSFGKMENVNRGEIDELLTKLISEAVCGNEELTRVFSKVVLAMLVRQGENSSYKSQEMKDEEQLQLTKGLWSSFPRTVKYEELAKTFEAFVVSKNLKLSPQLLDHPAMNKYLTLISPSLSFPNSSDEEAGPILTPSVPPAESNSGMS